MKKKVANEDSDEFEADEPEEFDESGSDWAPEEDPNSKKRKGRPKATPKKAPATKKKKVEKKPEPPSDEEEEEDEDEEGEGEGEGEEGEEEEEEDEEGEEGEDSDESDSDAAGNGSFVVLKSDLKDAGATPPLWKIDGKALLQKYIPIEQDGKQLHKSTSTYSGWTQNNRDQYATAPVTFIVQGKKETIIEFLRDQVNLDEKPEEDEPEEKEKEKAKEKPKPKGKAKA